MAKQKMIPYAKLSKKQKRAYDQQKRVTWNMNPVTRQGKNVKRYQRKKSRNWMDEFPNGGIFSFLQTKKSRFWYRKMALFGIH